MPRLFSGIEIPDGARAALARLAMPLPGARWIADDELHITLRFAGDVDNPSADELADALAQISLDCFEVRIAGIGSFGGNDPRAVWAGVEGGEPLAELARLHERAARQIGLPPETRPFKPHVTLARLRGSRPDAVARFLQHNVTFRLEPFVVERFVLYSSRPMLGGGPYVVEDGFPLRGGMMGGEDGENW